MLSQSMNAAMQDPSLRYVRQTRTLASQFTYSELADIYNQTRVDYIVPMPMNARNMEQYVTQYDVQLDASVVSQYDNAVSGIAMLGQRDDRAWITRLGVIPEMRGKKVASYLVECLIRKALMRGMHSIQLEIIKGNDAAQRLFSSFGFTTTRKLVVIRRPPTTIELDTPIPGSTITPLTPEDIITCLNTRPAGATWVEETRSLLQMDNLQGYTLKTAASEWGWAIFDQGKFQLSHVVLDASVDAYDRIVSALLNHIHHNHPLKDTKIENIPADHPSLPLYRNAGYIESFRRIEMILTL